MSSVQDDPDNSQTQELPGEQESTSDERELSNLFDDNQEQQEKGPRAAQENSTVFKNAIANIFGDSDSDLDDLGEVQNVVFDDEDSDREIELPSFKKRSLDDGEYSQKQPSAKKVKKARKQNDHSSQSATKPEKEKSEAQADIDNILQRLKPARPIRASDLQNEVEVDEIIGKLTDAMRDAASKDRELNKAGNPAIAKLKLLPRVMLEISKPHWQNQLLEGGVLECIRFWLDPLDDGSLPSLDIQQSMMTAVDKMQDIDTHYLRTSKIGRVVRFYTKCNRVTPLIRKTAEELIRKWMRPILGKSKDFKHKKFREVRYDAPARRATSKVQTVKPGQFERPTMASIPQKLAANFNVVPVSSLTVMSQSSQGQSGMAAVAGGDKKNDRFKKMKAIMKSKRT